MSASKGTITPSNKDISLDVFKEIVMNDYRIACESREASLLGRKEVLTGKAKFGIFGDGKEVAQIAMAKAFKEGDFRAGYYRDQTFMMAAGLVSIQELFAQLYAHADVEAEPSSAGRQMNAHFATRSLHPDGTWKELASMKNSSSDISPTGSQMPRLLGLAYASRFFRENPDLSAPEFAHLSNKGNEVAFGTIGDASTSEGMFFETINAAAVLQVPFVVSVWDDGYGISVPKVYQTVKQSISKALSGFQKSNHSAGIEIYYVKGWDYAALCDTYERAVHLTRTHHVPALVHVDELTQPQGHSTSGSHERYKAKGRLEWEKEFDCIRKMREWILSSAIASPKELDSVEQHAHQTVAQAKQDAWKAYLAPIKNEISEVAAILSALSNQSAHSGEIQKIEESLISLNEPYRGDISGAVKKTLFLIRNESLTDKARLQEWLRKFESGNRDRFNSWLHSETTFSPLHVERISPSYEADSKMVDGREILRDNFDAILANYPQSMIFGEDTGRLGGVNQGLEGLQKKYGEHRVFDTGIREATIIGQGIGLALRGLRPIAEIQYLDYILYALQIMSDDLATVQYRTKGGQKAPLVISTRGHRLEGIWHSGSPMAGIINLCRGIHICVPRNMTKAAGFYNTLLRGDDPGIVVEPLNSYRLKEKMPSNVGEFTEPLGIPEIIREGTDVTVVTYGPLCRISMLAAERLEEAGISTQIIDVQTLLPFDTHHTIAESLKKTNRILFLDEDLPGGTTAFMLQKVLEEQGGYSFLDSPPKTLSGKEHRPAYGSDGVYFSKPVADDIFDAIYEIMREAKPGGFPGIY